MIMSIYSLFNINIKVMKKNTIIVVIIMMLIAACTKQPEFSILKIEVRETIINENGESQTVPVEGVTFHIYRNGSDMTNLNETSNSEGNYEYIVSNLVEGDYFKIEGFKNGYKKAKGEIKIDKKTGTEDNKLVLIMQKE